MAYKLIDATPLAAGGLSAPNVVEHARYPDLVKP
jgi:hypothetical protein